MTTKWHYRVTVAQRFDHLPEAVQPTTDWLPASSLRQARRAVQNTVHVLAQSLGRTTDTGGKWRITSGIWLRCGGYQRGRVDSHEFELKSSDTVPLAIVGEVRRAS